jgi:hypothetical protein
MGEITSDTASAGGEEQVGKIAGRKRVYVVWAAIYGIIVVPPNDFLTT